MFDDRFDGILKFIRTHFDEDSRALIKKGINGLGSRKDSISKALSLGERDQDKSAAETERRNGVRTLLFLAFTEGKQPLELAETFKAKYLAMDLETIKKEIKGRLPVMDSSPRRRFWDPGTFTKVWPAPKIQMAPRGFRYMVFGMMNTKSKDGTSYDEMLENPNILKTFLLSCSIIDEDRIATYYPYGFILEVPLENILCTSTEDLAFKNYSRNPFIPKVQQNDRTAENKRVIAATKMMTPQEILGARTSSEGDIGYNEIVVLGTGSEKVPKEINVVGFFMKVDSRGDRYAKPEHKKVFVNDDLYKKLEDHPFPIVHITDKSGIGK